MYYDSLTDELTALRAGKVDAVFVQTDQAGNVLFDVANGHFSRLSRGRLPNFPARVIMFVILSDLEIGAGGSRKRLGVAHNI